MGAKEGIIEYKISVFINENEFFWINELRNYLGGNCLLLESPEYKKVYGVLSKLKNKKIIICSENKGSEKQYMRIKLIEHGKI